MKCPKCQTEAAQVGNFWICSNHGQLAEARNLAPLRIFLSYGHDANEELVRYIKADLEKRGHDVWFDKSEIKFGEDWRRSITDGVLHSQRVVAFLSKHSTRDPGVCRDEIAIALGVKGGNIQTILVESEAEVQPPVNIGHIQWLDMHDWRERHAVGEAAWEQWYQAKLAEIVRVVESDESRRFAGEIETLNGHLKPIKSEARICQLLSRGFYGRQWLFEVVEKWRQDTNQDSRLFWIMGAPGVGKSAFAAQLTHTRGDTVIAAQFCEWDKPDHRNAPRVVRSLAFQLATRLPDYRKLLLTLAEIAELDRKDVAELFDYLLANPLRSVIHGGRERYLIVIDALDEAGEAGRNPLVEMLARNAQRLPDWLGLVVTSRPEFDVKTPLQALNPFPLDTKSESNRADIRAYLRRELATHLQDRPDAERLVEQILEKSEGVFLYVERFCDDVQRAHRSLDRPEQYPQGLGGIFADYFKRQFPDLEKFRQDVRPALRAILAAREPLPVELLQRLFNWQDEQLRDFTRTLGSLFPVMKETNGEVIKPYHKSLADWLADKAKGGCFYAEVSDGHAQLADLGWAQLQSNPAGLHRYLSVHLLYHQQAVGRWEQAQAALLNPAFRQAKIRATSVGQLSEDFRHVLAQWPLEQPGVLLSVALMAATLARHLSEHGPEEPDALARCIERSDYLEAAHKAVQTRVPPSFVAALGLRALAEDRSQQGLAVFELVWQGTDADVCAVLGLGWRLIPRQAMQVLERLLDVRPEATARIELINGVLYHGGPAVVGDVLRFCLNRATSWNDADLVACIIRLALPYAAETAVGEEHNLLLALVSTISDQRLVCELLSELSMTAATQSLKPSEEFASRFVLLAQRQIIEDSLSVLPHAAFLLSMSGRTAEALDLLKHAELHIRTVRMPLLVRRMALALNLVMDHLDTLANAVCRRLLGALQTLQERDQAPIHLFRFCAAKAVNQPRADDLLTQAIKSAEAFTTPGELLRFAQLASRLVAKLRAESRTSSIEQLLPLMKAFADRRDLSAQAVCHLAAALPPDSELRTQTLHDILEDLSIEEAASLLLSVRPTAPALAADLASHAVATLGVGDEAATRDSRFEGASPGVFGSLARAAALADVAPEVTRVLLQATDAQLHSSALTGEEANAMFGLRVILACGAGNLDSATDLTCYPRQHGSRGMLFLPATCSRLLLKMPPSAPGQFTATIKEWLVTPRVGKRERLRQLQACGWLSSRVSQRLSAALAGLIPGESDLSGESADMRLAAASLVGALLDAGLTEAAKALLETILKHLPRNGLEHLQVAKELACERRQETLQLWHVALLNEFRAVPSGVPSARVLVAACRLLAAVPPESKSLQIDQLFFNFAQNFFMFPAGSATAAALAHASIGLTRLIQIEETKSMWSEHLAKFAWGSRQSPYERTTRSEMFALAAADLCATGEVVNARELVKLAIEALPDASPLARGFGAIRDSLATMSARCNSDSLADALLKATLAATQRSSADQIVGVAAEAEILMNRPDHADRLLEQIRTPSRRQAFIASVALIEYFFSPQQAAARLAEIEGTPHARNVAQAVLLTAGLPEDPPAYRALIPETAADMEGLDALIAGCVARSNWNPEHTFELAKLMQPAPRPILPNSIL